MTTRLNQTKYLVHRAVRDIAVSKAIQSYIYLCVRWPKEAERDPHPKPARWTRVNLLKWWMERDGVPPHGASIEQWLHTMPKGVKIEFRVAEIIELAKEWGWLAKNPNTLETEVMLAGWYPRITTEILNLLDKEKTDDYD